MGFGLEKRENLADFADKSEKQANENPTTDKQLFWPCEQCGGSFKLGYDEDKKKELPQNPDGSRHQKWKYPPKEVEGKKVWEWICTKSKDDWSQKTGGSFKPQPVENIQFPKLPDIEKNITKKLIEQSKALSFHKIAILKGVQEACKESGITHPATVGMIFNKVEEDIRG